MTINTTFTAGSVLTAAQMNNLPWGVISSTYNTTATINNTSTAVQSFFTGPAFTPVVGRKYRVSWSIGAVYKFTNLGNITIELRKDSTTGTIIDASYFSGVPLNTILPHSKSTLLTSTEMGTASFIPTVCVTANTAGMAVANIGGFPGSIIFEDIGAA
ncbi:hypothetical protein UFOVP1054_10 [uncultured Caudovirales phage]|uniref:Uncharacterized protein n=1 Tax=uncultured Caudovirales phage TaxID=2100421 RepID=A0A6J5QEK8_9CAUD|nr:hypothetical protein UFOVP1054_10 [uncultured Caudovirales phage]